MIKLLRYLKKRDWFLIVIILALAFLQVYCMMTLTDYIKGITQAITFLDYHNQGPLNFFLSFANGNAEMETTIKAALSGFTSWDQFSDGIINNIAGMVTAQGQDPAAVTSMLLSIRNATTGDIWWNAGMMILTATGMIAVQALISVIAAYIASRLATSLRNALNTQISSFSQQILDCQSCHPRDKRRSAGSVCNPSLLPYVLPGADHCCLGHFEDQRRILAIDASDDYRCLSAHLRHVPASCLCHAKVQSHAEAYR